MPQTYVFPGDLFNPEAAATGRAWTCVRTRARCEKKLADWLVKKRRAHFLPVVAHATSSGRKRRVSMLPLFPGFVFVEGIRPKREFSPIGVVAYVLHAEGERAGEQLDQELTGIWRALESGLYQRAVETLPAGESCVIRRGPLEGHVARFERPGRDGRLVLQVEMMGRGLVVEVPAEDVIVAD